MDQDERERKLEAGRAKLADFRQRRAKSESSRTQKKTQKRKGQTVEADDLPTQERHLMEEDHQTGCAEASLRLEDTDNSGAETELGRKTHEQNADEQSSSSGSVEDIGLQSESDLSVAHSGKEQLMQLQAAVEKRNEIISRLSKNLQVALQSREQVQSEALQLTELIQALQQQLQQFKAKEFLRNRSQGCVDMTQVAQNQLHLLLEESQQTTKEHQKLLVNKEAEITDLQQKLSAMEKSLFQLNYAFEQKKDHNLEVTLEEHFGKYSEDMTINSETLIRSLRAELEQERKNSQKAQGLLDAFQTNVKILEEQRLEMEAKLASLTESKTGELQKCKLEKDELSKEMSGLNGLVQEFQNRLEEEETTSRHLRSKYEDDISIYDTRLQNLEEESKLKIVQMIEAHESALKHLHEEHSVEVQRIQALLDQAQQPAAFHNSVSFEHCSEIHWIKDSAEHYTENIANECAASHNYSFDVSVEGFQDALMERYLASDRQQESSINEGSTESLSTSKFELEHEVSLHISRNDANSEMDQSGMSLVHGVEVELSARSFAPCQISVGEETNESADGVDLTKELLVQQCRDLSDQLEDRERLLKVLQEEVRRSAEEVEEARERWCKISEVLEDAKSELEKECEKREGYEEVIKHKKLEEDDLRNLLRHLQDRQHMQQPNKIDFTDPDNDTCKHLPKEQEDKLVAEHQCPEQIIKDGSEEKAAGESLISEVQALFDMLLQQTEQRDKILDTHQENKELQDLKYHVHELEEKLQHTEEEKLELESNLTCLKGNLTAMEDEKDLLERRFFALESRAKSMEKVLEEELENFEHQLQFKEDKLKKDGEAREKSEEEHMEKESVLMKELHAVKQDLEEEQKHHKQQCEKLRDEHQKEINDLKQSFEKQFSEQRTHLEEEQRKQIILIKQVHEREHDRELSQLEDQQSKEIDRLKDDFSSEIREGLETAHQAELLQTQTRHNLDIEALRLSLTNLHTAQLELAQTNMQKDKELALSELQSMLREKWAQESAMLQTRQQFELERVREQSREQEQRTQRNHQEEIKNLNEELEKRLLEETCLAEQINNLKNREAELLAEAETTRTTLFQAQARLEEAHQSREQDIKSLEKELKQALTDRDAAACAVEELVSRHKVALQEQHDRTRALEQEVEKLQELKASSEQDFTNLWCQLEDMRTNRQQLGELKEQLLARTQRVEDIEKLKQDFTRQRQDIKEQNELELENLRAYFEERLRVSEEGHREEIALLQLRLVEGSLEDSVLKTGDASFLSEEKVEDATSDKSSLEQHKEELSFLRQQLEETHQQELVQMQSRMVLSYKEDLLQARTELTDQYYKEIDQLNTKHAHELEQLRARLSDNHIKEINKLRMLSAQDVARQVEAEVKEKTQQLLSSLESVSVEHKEHLCLMEMKNEELKNQVVAQSVEEGLSSQMISEDPRLKDQLEDRPACPTTELLQSAQQERDEMERRLSDLQKVLDEEQAKLEALQSSLENETNPHLVALKQKLQTLEEKLTSQRAELIEQHAVELQAQKALQDQCTSQLESLEKLCRELKLNHLKELESLKTLHGSSLATLEKELTMKYQAELDKLEAVLQEANLAQLEAQETKLQARHKQEREELEERLLGNMDTVESALLNEIEVLREENEKKLHHLKESSALEIEKARKDEQTIREELRCELAKVYTDKFSSMAAELNHGHQEKMSEALSSQKAVLENEHCAALEALAQQVVALEQQHSTALLEITSIAATEKQYQEQQLESLASQHQQQLQELRGVSARELEALRRELEEEASRQRLHFLEESNRAEAVALEDLEKTLKQQHQQTEDAYRDKMSQLTAQLQQLDTVVSQLRAEVSGLQVELESKQAEKDTLESLLQGREREKQEGDNLLAMLRADLSMATQHSQDLQTSRETLQCILMEIFQVTVATEENISRKLSGGSGSKAPKAETAKSSQDSETSEVMSAVGKSTPWSSTMDEGLELSQRLCESMFTGSDGEIDARGKELMLGACTRLSSSVDKLLDLLSESSQQMCGLQALFNEQFRDGGEAGASLLFQNAQLLEQLDCEARLRSQLQLELHKAEGLMEGYLAEKSTLEEALQKKETQVHRLAKELESTRNQLQELSENHGLLLRQRDALTSGLGDTEKALLVEAERLARECVEVQHQAQKDCGSLASRLRLLEQALEDQDGNAHQLDEQHRLQTEDLQQHIDALEKQLKQNRQFIDEQAVEREHERDEFQQEIKNLEAQLKNPTKAPQGGDKGQKVESLQALIKDKIDDYSVLLLAKEQCQRDVEERNEEIEKLASCIRELEQALLNNVEASRNATQLEQELHRARKNIQELSEDKEALQQQQYANKLQISALQSKLDETKHRFSDTPPDPNLRELLNSALQDVQTKEKQVELLAERVNELERAVEVKEEEMRQLMLQLELNSCESRKTEDQLHFRITDLQETVDALTSKIEECSDESLVKLPSDLLEQKNLVIDSLNQQIFHLQQELATTTDNKVLEENQAEIEELRSVVERLRYDQERLRQAKEEESEQLHEVINKLQEELSQLDPNHHEISDPNTDSPESSVFPWSPHPSQQRVMEESLCQELSSQTLQSSHARLKELQKELDDAVGEKDALQRLLLSQQDQVDSLGQSLREEKETVIVLEKETEELKIQLKKKQMETESLLARVKLLEDEEQTRQSSLREHKLLLRAAEERRDDLEKELDRLQEEVQQQSVEKEHLEQTKELVSLQEQIQKDRAIIDTLETGKRELFVERETLRKRERCLQEEIEQLKQEVTSKISLLKQMQEQQEEAVAKQGEAQKEVLTCAEETLAKAETALLEREQQLIQLKAEHDSLRAELAAVKEWLSSSTERAEKLLEEGQTKDRALADLEVHNQHLKAKLRSLQDDLAVQEEELAYQQQELELLRKRCRLQDHPTKPGHSFLEDLSHDPSLSINLSSPEMLRRLDCSEQHPSRLHVSHLSEFSALELHSKTSPMEQNKGQAKASQSFNPPLETPPPIARSPSSQSVSEPLFALDSLGEEKVHELDDLDVTLSRSPRDSTSPGSVPEWVSDGYGSNVSSELEAMLKLELENTERLDAHFVEYLRCRGMSPAENTDSAAGSMHDSHEPLSPQLQAVLKRVYQESCRILSLSHRPAPSGQSRPDSEPAPPPSWQRERRALQETILSLRELLCRMADREPKTEAGDASWRCELLQAVHSLFDSEREWLHSQLQSVMAASAQVDVSALMVEMKRLFQTQEQQQWQSLEKLFSADRHSLLAEVRSLHVKLNTTAQQNQEHLQQLQKERSEDALNLLNKDVEDLQFKLKQEKTLSRDLHASLEDEKNIGAVLQKRLEAELETTQQLQTAQNELQGQLLQLRVQLESVEADYQASLHAVEKEQGRVKNLQQQLQQEKLHHQQTTNTQKLQAEREDQQELQNQLLQIRLKLEQVEADYRASLLSVEKEQDRVKNLQQQLQEEKHNHQQATNKQESLQAVMNKQASRLGQLNSALEQERVVTSNLRSDLQIEQSRCEALLSQERERTGCALSHLEEERSRTKELSDSLSRQAQEHSRLLDEEARRHEATTAHDRMFIQELRLQLEQERRQGEDLATMLERLQGQVLKEKRKLTENAGREAREEQEDIRRLRDSLESLLMQKTEVGRVLEAERERAIRLQAELDGMKQKIKLVKEKAKEKEELMERQWRREKQEQVDKEQQQEVTKDKLLELELLRQEDQQKLKRLQQTIYDMEQSKTQITSERLQRDTHTSGLILSQNTIPLNSQSHVLQDSTALSPSLIERLLKENSDFSKCLASMSEEKVSLKHTISCLEREMHVLKGLQQVKPSVDVEQCILSEKVAWQKEKTALQTTLRKAEIELSELKASNENRPAVDISSNKMQRLYERYTRAECYRKSLVYQKRYLLLLLGEFQVCEQVTLAHIARMGAQPTPSRTVSSPLIRFRTSVRVVIAISRLKFLTRKWQRATRKLSTSSANKHGKGTVPALRSDVLKPQQPTTAFNSPPTRDHAFSQLSSNPSMQAVKSPFRPNTSMHSNHMPRQTERSFSSSQDPDLSLTHYIQHLETVQHRLGDRHPGSTSVTPFPRKSDR